MRPRHLETGHERLDLEARPGLRREGPGIAGRGRRAPRAGGRARPRERRGRDQPQTRRNGASSGPLRDRQPAARARPRPGGGARCGPSPRAPSRRTSDRRPPARRPCPIRNLRSPRRRGDGAVGLSARRHDLAPVAVRDGADRGRGPDPRTRRACAEARRCRRSFSTHLTSAPGNPPHARIARPLSSTRTGRDSIAYAERAFCSHDLGRIEGLRLGEVDVQPLDRRSRAARPPAPFRRGS